MSTNYLPALPTREARRVAQPQDLVALLEAQHRQKIDVVAPLSALRYSGGAIEVGGLDPYLDDGGVTEVNGLYRPTANAEGQVGNLLGIPGRYMAKMRAEHLGLLDTNVNEWTARADGKNVLLRLMYGSDERHPDSSGIVRAVLSDRYGIRDNYDTALAVLDGMRAAGLGADHFMGADITDNRMWIRIAAPELYVNAPELLAGYRDPRTGRSSSEVGDVVFAGVVITNSETGGGKVKVTPELTVLVCTNGMTINKDAFGQVHLGATMDEGTIVWSDDTRNAAMELTKRQVRDAIGQFMNRDYVAAAVADLSRQAGIEVADAPKTIEVVGKKLGYTQEERNDILSAFIKGGQLTAGGVMQAVTYAAQGIDDVERANEFAATGVEAMALAAAVR